MSKKAPQEGLIIDLIRTNKGNVYRVRRKSQSTTLTDADACVMLGTMFRQYLVKLPKETRDAIALTLFPKEGVKEETQFEEVKA